MIQQLTQSRHEPFLEALAKPEPIPGGGAAAAYGAAVGLALLEKIVRLELQRRPMTSDLRSLWAGLLEQVCTLARALYRLRDEDGKAYMRFAEARASGMEDQYISAALDQAVDSPLRIMKTASEGMDCVSQAGKHCRHHLLSDLLVVCELLRAAVCGAYRITQANLSLMADASRKSHYQRKSNGLLERWGDSFQQVEGSILARTGAAGK